MATVLNSFGQYINQTSQHQMIGSIAGFAASQMTSQNMLPRIPDTGYSHNQGYSQSSSMYPLPGQSESLKAPSSLGQHYYVDQMMNPHPYSSLYHGLDINAIRRKNATRETTGPLKAWLKAHRKNPYPTKGEKVMLAISTRMTLTQVSTWFANARRRMKKDKLDDEDDDGQESLPDMSQPEKRARSGSMSSSMSHYSTSEADTSKDLSDISDIDVDDSTTKKRPTKKCVQRLFSPDPRTDHVIDPPSSPESLVSERLSGNEAGGHRLPSVSEIMPAYMGAMKMPTTTSTPLDSQKPKIWSISEIIGSASSTLRPESSATVPHSYNSVPYSDYFSMGQAYAYPTIDSTVLSAYNYHNKLMDNASYSQSTLQFL